MMRRIAIFYIVDYKYIVLKCFWEGFNEMVNLYIFVLLILEFIFYVRFIVVIRLVIVV